jgi:hypothetical protein
MTDVIPNTALFCIYKRTTFDCELCDPCQDSWTPDLCREETDCTCRDIRYSFVPSGTQFFLSKHPSTVPLETEYMVFTEMDILHFDRTADIVSEKSFGFAVASDDPAGLESLSFMAVKNSFTVQINPNVKKAQLYSDVSITKLIKLMTAPKKYEKKENPHIGRKKKAVS